jgi:hypothetical protein
VTDVNDTATRERDAAARGPRVLLIASETVPAKYLLGYVEGWGGTTVGPQYFDGREAPRELLDKDPEVDFALVENDSPGYWSGEMRAWIRALNNRGIPIVVWSDHLPDDIADLVLARMPFWPAPLTLLETVEKCMPELFSTLVKRDPAALRQQVDAVFAQDMDEEF